MPSRRTAGAAVPTVEDFEQRPELAEAAIAFCRGRGLLVGEPATTVDLAQAPLGAIADILRRQPDLRRKQLATLVDAFVAQRRRLEERLPVADADLEELAELRASPVLRGEWGALLATIRERRLTGYERALLRLLWLFGLRDDAHGLERALEEVLDASRQQPWFARALAAAVALHDVLWGQTNQFDRVPSLPHSLLRRLMAELLLCFAHYEPRFEALTAELPPWRRDDQAAWRFGPGRTPIKQERAWRDDWRPRPGAAADLAAG